MILRDDDMLNVVSREDKVVIGTRRSDPAGGPADYTEIAILGPEKAFLLVEVLNDAIGRARAVADKNKEARRNELVRQRNTLQAQIDTINRELGQ